ncbi:MAG: 6-carboxytetrahydropterin synthase [Planctomycetia bacterium]|nr:6-carboxytetrahydropterin synthase [Planctomycetia bacterium]
MKKHAVRVSGEGLKFSAAHFITFENGDCEFLHGHDFRFAVEVELPLAPNSGYAIDFLQLQSVVMKVVAPLDHKVLLQGESSHLIFSVRESEPEGDEDLQNWISKIGGWLSSVNNYQSSCDSLSPSAPDVGTHEESEEMRLERRESLRSELERYSMEHELEHQLSRELGLPPTPDEIWPAQNPESLEGIHAEVEVRHRHRRWVFPEEECVILPLDNTTAERLAEYIAQQLAQSELLAKREWTKIRVELSEATGMIGICELLP